MFDFNKMVEAHLYREQRQKSIGRYYPSEIGSCLRKIFYGYKYPQELDAEKRKVFEVGNIMHGFVVEVLKSEKNREVELLQSEFPIKIQAPEFIVSGRVDDLVLVKQSGKNLLVEVKSTRSLGYVDQPSAQHRMQLQLYMHATGIHNGIVLYIDKNNLQNKTFEVPYSEEEALKIMGRFEQLHVSLSNDLLPVAEAKKSTETDWMCRYCEYTSKCSSNEK